MSLACCRPNLPTALTGSMGDLMTPQQGRAFATPMRRPGYRFDCLMLETNGDYRAEALFAVDFDPFAEDSNYYLDVVFHHTSAIGTPCSDVTDPPGFQALILSTIARVGCDRIVLGNEDGLQSQSGALTQAQLTARNLYAAQVAQPIGIKCGGSGILWAHILAAATGGNPVSAAKADAEIAACVDAGLDAVAFHAYPNSVNDLSRVIGYIRTQAPGLEIWCNEFGFRTEGHGPDLVFVLQSEEVPFGCYASGEGPNNPIALVFGDGSLTPDGQAVSDAIHFL